jgi:hypothetical protein
MRPDYDLSGLETSQADLWLSFQADAIRAEILDGQAKRQGFTLFGGSELEELCGLFTQAVSPAALPGSAALMCPYAVSLWMH